MDEADGTLAALEFLSTLSLRRATRTHSKNGDDKIFLSTLSLRRATNIGQYFDVIVDISIHALLAESDHLESVPPVRSQIISIHALLAESDVLFLRGQFRLPIFLSTLSLRRATYVQQVAVKILVISIHALLAESDPL